tara:strand:- start:29461 stop:31941 length:2481 start_codon:yes stop_codon:yes gene_type:complete
MGRLVKAFSKDDAGEESLSIEAQFLKEASALAARIQQELQAEASESRRKPADDSRRGESSDRGVGAGNSSASNSSRPQLGRDVYAGLDGEWARMNDSPTSGESALDGLRLFTGSEESASSEDETLDTNTGAEAIRQELMDELAQEQRRWAERHAMQVRSIEEQARQLALVDAEIEVREQELDRRERELDARAREQAARTETEVRSRNSREAESIQKELERLAAEVRVHAGRASQYEAELAEARREHAIELDNLRSLLNRHDDSRTDRARSVIDECDERMAELTAQRAAWQAEQSRRREELARERLEQRDEARLQREAQLAELALLREEFEKERESTIARLDRERREWNEKFTREQDELLDLKQAVDNEAKRVRADLAREKSEWGSHQERMRIALREEQGSAQELLNAKMTDMERLKQEQTATLDKLRKDFESERSAWHRERGQEAAILQAERSELEMETDRLHAERSLVEAERQKLAGDLERQRAEHDESLRESWRSHQASIQQAEQEAANRQRVLAANLQQQQNELAARMQQAEHEIRTARELSARQIAQDKERFAQTCATHEAELQRARAELNVQRQQFEREKREFADESSRTRAQTEKERSVIRNSLSQMDAQLRAAATCLLTGSDAVGGGFESCDEKFNQSGSVTDPASGTQGSPVQASDGDMSETQDVAELPVVESENLEETPVEAWEPGKEATLAETTSSDLVRRFDGPSETGGVAGLARPPRIASRGVLVQAVSDAMAAEIVYEESDEQSDCPAEWAGIVATRTEDATTAASDSEQQDGRRQALESYRSKLSMLQAQLRQLSTPAANETGSDLSDNAND